MRRTYTTVGILFVALLAVGAGVTSHLAAAGNPDVRTVPMDGFPLAVAVDPTTAHAFVLTRTRPTRGVSATGFPTGETSVSVLDTSNGKMLRAVAVGAAPVAVAVDQSTGHAFVATDDNSVSVLDTQSGDVLRTVAVGSLPQAIAVDPRTGRAFVVNTGDNTVSVLDTRKAVVLRTVHLQTEDAGLYSPSGGAVGGYNTSPPAYSRPNYGGGFNGGFIGGFGFGYFQRSVAVVGPADRVYVGGAGAVSVIDARNGAVLNTLPLTGYNTRLAVDTATGQIYAAGYNGLSVLDGRTGQVQRTVATGGPASAVAIDSRRGRIYVAHADLPYSRGVHSGPGTVSVLDARTGAILRTLPVGIAPTSLAIDESTGRVIVVNAGGRVQVHDAWTWLPGSLQRYVPFHTQQTPDVRLVAGSISLINPVQ
jgi:YVTN family beta-propeller protein